MSALRNVEDTIGGFVERVFGRMFRGYVEPVELARKLAREMEDHKTVSVTRVYVPNEFVVYLSSADRNRFSSFEGALTTELGVYISERARHEGFTLLSAPQVRLETDTDLRLGEYGIACRVVDPPAEHQEIPEVDAATPDLPPSLTRFEPAVTAPPAPLADAPGEDGLDAPAPADGEEAQAAEADGMPPEDAEIAAEPAAGEAPAGEAEGADAPAGTDDPAAQPLPAGPAAAGAAGAVASRLDGDPEPEAEPQPELEAEPQPELEPQPEPAPEPAPEPVAAVVPEPEVAPPAPTPLPPPGGYEPLAGVSGTQILSPAEARAEGLVQEEMALIIDGRRHRVTQRTTTIGRSRDCDVVLQDANASRRHAEVRHIGLDYFIVDLGSTNGTIVNGQRVRRQALAHGDRILVGITELVVEHTA